YMTLLRSTQATRLFMILQLQKSKQKKK
ncbi:putative metal-dependent phosphohydrolase, partial [Vibrio parahaemolyticus V-223/04]